MGHTRKQTNKARGLARVLAADSGASAVEFALVLPLLIVLVFGIIQFGIYYNRAQGLQAAAREGARIASVGATLDQITQRVQDAQSLFNPATDVLVTVPDGTCQTAGVGNQVTVVATVNPSDQYAIDIPLFGKVRFTYQSTGIFRCERTGS